MEMNSIRRQEQFFRADDQLELYVQVWRAPQEKAFLLLTHGMGEHSDRYHELALDLSQLGISTIGWDLRGHGRSGGQRGYVANFDEFVTDQLRFFEFAHKWLITKDKLPFFYFGHSMGG